MKRKSVKKLRFEKINIAYLTPQQTNGLLGGASTTVTATSVTTGSSLVDDCTTIKTVATSNNTDKTLL